MHRGSRRGKREEAWIQTVVKAQERPSLRGYFVCSESSADLGGQAWVGRDGVDMMR